MTSFAYDSGRVRDIRQMAGRSQMPANGTLSRFGTERCKRWPRRLNVRGQRPDVKAWTPANSVILAKAGTQRVAY